jgi:uncharacterized SAM-binding protein YcdF (DUF218 family)
VVIFSGRVSSLMSKLRFAMLAILFMHSILFSILISCRCFVPFFAGSHLLMGNKPFRITCVPVKLKSLPFTNDIKLRAP